MTTSTPSPIEKDTEFYYPDGNIILAVGEGRGGKAFSFRVLLSQLASCSDVFRDMTNIADLETNGETLDGLPLLRLDDEPKDIRDTFRLLWTVQ